MQKGFHIAWQNGLVSLWKNLPTLDAARDHIRSDYVRAVGIGVVGKADSDMVCHVFAITCCKF